MTHFPLAVVCSLLTTSELIVTIDNSHIEEMQVSFPIHHRNDGIKILSIN